MTLEEHLKLEHVLIRVFSGDSNCAYNISINQCKTEHTQDSTSLTKEILETICKIFLKPKVRSKTGEYFWQSIGEAK